MSAISLDDLDLFLTPAIVELIVGRVELVVGHVEIPARHVEIPVSPVLQVSNNVFPVRRTNTSIVVQWKI